jgi:hypothetical protein
MRGVLADINMVGQGVALVSIWTSDAWRDLWTELGLTVETFASLGLPFDAPDTLIWRTCQREGIVLMTDNRNDDGPDSLEATIRHENQSDSLPVITIADTDRILRDRPYAERVAERLLDYLMRIDEIRGTGRLYVP